MQEVAFDVKIEPGLAGVSENVKLASGYMTEDTARSDDFARGLWL